MQFSCDNAAVVSVISSKSNISTPSSLLFFWWRLGTNFRLMPCHVIICLFCCLAPQEFWIPCISNTKRIGQHTGYPRTRNSWNIDHLVQHYLRCSLAPSTKWPYAVGQCRYVDLCIKASLSPFPTVERKLCSFAAILGHKGLKDIINNL